MKENLYTVKDRQGTVIAQDLNAAAVSKLIGISKKTVGRYARTKLRYKNAYEIVRKEEAGNEKAQRSGMDRLCQEWDDICAVLRRYNLSHIIISCKQ